MIVSLVVQAALLVWLINASSAWMFYVFAALWGVTVGGWAPLMPVVAGELFGLRRIGSIVGAMGWTYGVGGRSGWLWRLRVHRHRQLHRGLRGGAGALILSAVIVPLLKPPKARAARGHSGPP